MNTKYVHCLVLLTIIPALVFGLIMCGNDNPSYSDIDDTATDDTTGTTGVTTTADHYAVARFDSISSDEVTAVQANLNIFYGHTSHGSQIVTGLSMLHNEESTLQPPPIHEISDDLGLSGDTTWVQPTRDYLASHSECNVVVWSWCGGCSDNTVDGINIYLNAMNQLETDYPAVTFVYMTGHLDGTGIDGTLYACNNQIRDYCAAHDKVLFDFADIESYDPDGNHYPDASDDCAWALDWCADHTCPDCASCAHSHCFNCYLKGKAMWWLMVQLVG